MHQKALVVLGNLSSDAFDEESVATKRLLRSTAVIAHLVPHLASRSRTTTLYATACLQNMCHDSHLAMAALSAGAQPLLLELVRVEQQPLLQKFAAGALHNVRRALRQTQGDNLAAEQVALDTGAEQARAPSRPAAAAAHATAPSLAPRRRAASIVALTYPPPVPLPDAGDREAPATVCGGAEAREHRRRRAAGGREAPRRRPGAQGRQGRLRRRGRGRRRRREARRLPPTPPQSLPPPSLPPPLPPPLPIAPPSTPPLSPDHSLPTPRTGRPTLAPSPPPPASISKARRCHSRHPRRRHRPCHHFGRHRRRCRALRRVGGPFGPSRPHCKKKMGL